MGVQQPIRIIVRNGNVTLEGVVDNEGDKNIANIRANGVPGVFSVTNNLAGGEELGSGRRASDLRRQPKDVRFWPRVSFDRVYGGFEERFQASLRDAAFVR